MAEDNDLTIESLSSVKVRDQGADEGVLAAPLVFEIVVALVDPTHEHVQRIFNTLWTYPHTCLQLIFFSPGSAFVLDSHKMLIKWTDVIVGCIPSNVKQLAILFCEHADSHVGSFCLVKSLTRHPNTIVDLVIRGVTYADHLRILEPMFKNIIAIAGTHLRVLSFERISVGGLTADPVTNTGMLQCLDLGRVLLIDEVSIERVAKFLCDIKRNLIYMKPPENSILGMRLLRISEEEFIKLEEMMKSRNDLDDILATNAKIMAVLPAHEYSLFSPFYCERIPMEMFQYIMSFVGKYRALDPYVIEWIRAKK